jgi:hypothetical protein
MNVVKSLAVVSMLFALSSCKTPKDLKGEYLGTIIQNNQEKNIIAFVNDANLKKNNTVEVIVSEINAKKDPIVLSFIFRDKNTTLEFKYNNANYTLDVNDSDPCIVAHSRDAKLNLCMDKDNIVIGFTDSRNIENSVKISVKKSDDLVTLNQKSSYSVDELIGRSKFLNYKVEQNAQSVYRSRQQISQAMGNLLPHINIGDVLSFATAGPAAFVGSVGNLVPFLFPSNWFQFKEAKEMYQAELKSYASLRGNEMNVVEGLVYVHIRNLALLEKVNKEVDWLQNLLQNIQMMERSGSAPQGSSELFSIKIGNLLLDKEQLAQYVEEEGSEIAQAVALPTTDKLNIDFPILPNLEKMETINANSCLLSLTQKSFELEAIDYLIKASAIQTKERTFSFLDPNSSAGLGFGTPSAFRIGKSYEEELRLKRKELSSLLQKKCVDSVNERNSSLRSFRIANQYLQNTSKVRDILIRKMILEGSLSEEVLSTLVTNADELLKFDAQRSSAVIQFVISEGKVNRLMLTGVYSNLGVGL